MEPPRPENFDSDEDMISPNRSPGDGQHDESPSSMSRSTGESNGPPGDEVSFARPLYVSHFLTTMNSRVFEFGAILFLAGMYPNSLTEVSTYAIVRSACAIFVAPKLGPYIDRSNRRTTVQYSIVWQRMATCTSCILFLLMTLDDTVSDSYSWKAGIFLVLCTLACIEKAASIANLVSVERDWVPVLAGDNQALLRRLNTQMRRIDLGCKLAGPLMVGWLQGWSTRGAIAVVGLVNVVSAIVEMWTTEKVYKSCTPLQAPRQAHTSGNGHNDPGTWSWLPWLREQTRQLTDGLRLYFTSTAAKPSFTLALLYCTVLSFNGQMVTYLVSAGFSSGVIASLRAASTLSELSATWSGPRMISKIGAVRSGSWCINYQLLCLAVTTGLFTHNSWLSGGGLVSQTAAIYLVIGVILSRAGLWGFDLSAQIIVQEEVEDDRRGSFSTMEAMFQNLFELLSFLSTLVFSKPDEFQWPVLASTGAVAAAAAIYASFVRHRRGHLLHLSCCPDPKSKGYLFHGSGGATTDEPSGGVFWLRDLPSTET